MSTYIIGITGGSGSGKSSLLEDIRKHFSEEQVCVLSQDDYYRPKEELHVDENGEINFDLPAGFYLDDMHADILKLKDGQAISREKYTFNNELAISYAQEFQPAPILIIEGLFVFYDERIGNQIDLKVFIHTKEELKVIRRIVRDKEERNYPLDDVVYKYQYHVSPAFDRYIAPYREEADIVINNNAHYSNGLKVLLGFLRDKLRA